MTGADGSAGQTSMPNRRAERARWRAERSRRRRLTSIGSVASGGRPVVEPGADVQGELVRSVVWAGERVGPEERLVDAVRAAGVTLQPFATGPGG